MNTQNQAEKQKRPWAFGVLLCILALVAVVAWIKVAAYPPGWDFRNNLYLPASLLLQGKSPYNIHVLGAGGNAVWFPMVIGFFFPLGILPLQNASNLWWMLNLVSLLGLVLISTGRRKPDLKKLVLTVLLIAIFPSTATHLDLGQVSILICLAMLVVASFEEKLPGWGIGLLLAFALTKPQLAIIFIPAYFTKVLLAQGARALWKSGMWTMVGVIVLSLPLSLLTPGWIPDFFANLQANQAWAHPSVYTYLQLLFGRWGRVLGWGYFGIGLGVAIQGVVRHRNRESLLWALALTSVVSPYVWSWDFVVLYPIMVHALFGQNDAQKTGLLFAGYAFVSVLFTVQKLSGRLNDIQSWWVPWSVLSVTASISRWRSNHAGKK